MKQITPAFCFGLRWQWRQFMALFKNGTGVPLKNNEKHLGNRGSLAQHLSCRAFPAFPDLSVRLWVAKRTRLSPPGPHWSCTAASQPERQNARMPYSTYTLSLSIYIYINTLIIYIYLYIYIYILYIYISYIYIYPVYIYIYPVYIYISYIYILYIYISYIYISYIYIIYNICKMCNKWLCDVYKQKCKVYLHIFTNICHQTASSLGFIPNTSHIGYTWSIWSHLDHWQHQPSCSETCTAESHCGLDGSPVAVGRFFGLRWGPHNLTARETKSQTKNLGMLFEVIKIIGKVGT